MGGQRRKSLVFSVCTECKPQKGTKPARWIWFSLPFPLILSRLIQRFILYPLLKLTKSQFLGSVNEFNMTPSHQNSKTFCCGVQFSQEVFSRIGQNHKISSSSLSRNVSVLLLTKRIYSKINISRVISCSINQENIISNKADVTEYSYRNTEWMTWRFWKMFKNMTQLLADLTCQKKLQS